MVQGRINIGGHSDHPAGRHSIQANQCPPPQSSHFFTGRMPFLPPNQQCQSIEGNSKSTTTNTDNNNSKPTTTNTVTVIVYTIKLPSVMLGMAYNWTDMVTAMGCKHCRCEPLAAAKL